MAHSHLPLKYWVEAFRTATYLTNRLPSKVIGNDTPLKRLFGIDPDYNFLKPFGCACFPFLRRYNTHKLHFRSKECIFLGYSLNHKGYQCLNPNTNRVYITRHVVCDELVFPFARCTNNSPNLLFLQWITSPRLLPPSTAPPSSDHHAPPKPTFITPIAFPSTPPGVLNTLPIISIPRTNLMSLILQIHLLWSTHLPHQLWINLAHMLKPIHLNHLPHPLPSPSLHAPRLNHFLHHILCKPKVNQASSNPRPIVLLNIHYLWLSSPLHCLLHRPVSPRQIKIPHGKLLCPQKLMH